MLKFISLEESFEICEADFSVNVIGSSVHNEVYVVCPNTDNIDELMERYEGINTFMIIAENDSDSDSGGHVFSKYRLNEAYVNPKNNEEIILIFIKDWED